MDYQISCLGLCSCGRCPALGHSSVQGAGCIQGLSVADLIRGSRSARPRDPERALTDVADALLQSLHPKRPIAHPQDSFRYPIGVTSQISTQRMPD